MCLLIRNEMKTKTNLVHITQRQKQKQKQNTNNCTKASKQNLA